MAVAVEVNDHGHPRFGADALNQALAAAWGMMTSTNCGMVIRAPTAARSVVGTSCTASAGNLAACKACATSVASARLL